MTTIIRTGTGTGAITVIGTTTMMISRPKCFGEDLPITRQVFSVSKRTHLESGRFSGVKPRSWLALEGGNTDTSAEMCSPTPKTVELLAVNANEIAQIAAPAEDGMENTCSPGRFRAVRNRYQPDNHRTNVAQNSS